MDTDTTLLNAARTMDKDALMQIFDLYSLQLYRYALHLCGDVVVADHIVGDVFAKLLEQLSLGKGPESNLRAYLYSMIYHLVVDEARYSRQRVPLDVAVSLPEDNHLRFLGREDPGLVEIILHAVQNDLSEDQRHVIVLRFWEEFSLLETAIILGKRVDHVKVIQARALVKLRKILGFQEIRKMPQVPQIKRSLSTSGGAIT